MQYISKYASKAESGLEAFSDILNRILNESQPKNPIITSVQKLLLHSVGERDISAQETCHILLGLPLYHSSRQFVFLNINKKAPRWIRSTGEGEESFIIDDKLDWTEKSPLVTYWDRPIKLENYTLFWLHLTHRLIKGQ